MREPIGRTQGKPDSPSIAGRHPMKRVLDRLFRRLVVLVPHLTQRPRRQVLAAARGGDRPLGVAHSEILVKSAA